MATTIQLLGPDDVLHKDDWVRPLIPAAGSSHGDDPGINSFSPFAGLPQNHFKWVKARDALGECWMGRTLREIDREMGEGDHAFEVVRGDLPKTHVWNWRAERRN